MKYSKLKLKNTKPASHAKPKVEQAEVEQIFNANLKVKDKITDYEPFKGSGAILTSGNSVHGVDTKFNTEVQKGDLIMMENLLLKTTQEIPVTLVFHDTSLLLENAFIQEFTTPTYYRIKKKTKVEKGEDLTQTYKNKVQDLKNSKTKGIKKSTMDVRVKKGVWSYEKKRVDIDPASSKEALLDIRQKMGKDKFCW